MNGIKMSKTGQEGFSLAELMVVVAIIGILTATAVPKYKQMRERSYVSTLEASLLDMQRNLEAIKASSGGERYPISSGWMVNNPASSQYVACSSLTGDASMLCSSMPILALHPVSINCVGSVWEVPSFLYTSDGTNYKLMAHCAGTAQAILKSRLHDPARTTWSLSVSNNSTVTDGW